MIGVLLLATACGGRVEAVAPADATIIIDATFEEAAAIDAADAGFDECSAPFPVIRACCGGKSCNGTCDPKEPTLCTCHGISGGCPPPTVCCNYRGGCVGPDQC